MNDVIQFAFHIHIFVFNFHIVFTWALFDLSTYPDVQEKVYTEINRVLGSKDVDPNSAKDLK